jgi:large subunit ribosomal protein L25
MAKTLVLKAQKREQTGTKSAVKVRNEGGLPAIVYGHKQEPAAIVLEGHNFVEAIHHGHRLFDVQVGRKKETMLVKDLQYDHLGRDLIHVDLIRVDVTETVKVEVAIEVKGVAQGTHAGGIIVEHMDRLEVECLVTDIPETIVVSVKELDVGDSLHVRDIEVPEGIKILSDESALVVACSVVAAAVSEAADEGEEEPTAPEVIGKGPEEDESSEEETK